MNASTGTPAPGGRSFLLAAATALGLVAWFAITKWPNPMARAAPFVRPKERWTADHFFNFLRALPASAMLALKKSLGILGPEAGEDQLHGGDQDARDIQKHALWVSSNVLSYLFRDETKLSYHELVIWVSQQADVPPTTINAAPTFALERELLKLLFAQLWDSMSAQQRSELLEKLDPNGEIKDKTAIVALSGAGALAALSATVAFAGFAFYTAMSITIASIAGAVGVTLPFAAYLGASSIVGVLSGPVGWAIMSVAALGGIALAGRANLRKTTLLIGQLHALKVEALVAAGVPEHAVFTA